MRYLVLVLVFTSVSSVAQYPSKNLVDYPDEVFWGDTHVHTKLSSDAYAWGNRYLDYDTAYKFAIGVEVSTSTGLKAKINRPLDFLVIADHSENFAVSERYLNEGAELSGIDDEGKIVDKLRSILNKNFFDDIEYFRLVNILGESDVGLPSAWKRVVDTAEEYNNPGVFTAFVGFEWSAYGPMMGNLHRVVIFKDGPEVIGETLPLSSKGSSDPESLWNYFERYERNTGGEVFAIPHNPNLSNGQMFSTSKFDGEAFTRDYAMRRQRWEPLLEVTQIKGDSEVYPMLSPEDRFSDFETWHSWLGKYPDLQSQNIYSKIDKEVFTEKYLLSVQETERKKYEYARSALITGLKQSSNLGINPFKFGMIGSSDSHTSLSAVRESMFYGKTAKGEPSGERIFGQESLMPVKGWEYSASGLAAVWAERNTRDALFNSMKRKEVYASTGPRITVRFFGGWYFHSDDAYKPDLARIGYDKGVPMGGDLTAAPQGASPIFLIRAVKDPDGANLDRVQVIKGWHDANGDLHEKIYNVALSDGRIDKGSNTEPVGNTVDIPDASYTNTIGDAELAVVWKDPDFDPKELAFYYLRVLEIPTPRWTAYDAKYFQLKNIPDEVPMITQERAYTSPIWYSPAEQ